MEGFSFDSRGLIYNNDFGDVTAEIGRYYSGLWFRRSLGFSIAGYPNSDIREFINALEQITYSNGILIRHPEAPYNEAYSGKFIPGRDQQHPLEVAASLWASTETGANNLFLDKWLRNLHSQQSKRPLSKYQNNDYPNPSHKMVMPRYFQTPSNWSLYWADGFLFGQSAILSHARPDLDDVADDLNHTLLCSHAEIFLPTKMSAWAMEYYGKNRPATFGTKMLLEQNHVLGAWAWYYRKNDPFTGESKSTLWGMPELWRPWIESRFK